MTAYEHPFNVALLQFERTNNGDALYSSGLHPSNITGTVRLNYAQADLSLTTEQEGAVNNRYATYLEQEMARHANAVLLDNDDAFLRNFIAPHAFGILNQMLSVGRPMLFTPDIAPPPCRLNFPFLVGRQEQHLLVDLEVYFEQYFTAGLRGLKFSVGNVAFTPEMQVNVEL